MKHASVKNASQVKIPRIGIYSGTFDPVHVGHVAFALQAIDAAGLDEVYFMPERRPRRKHGVTHYGHRVAMLKKVVRPHKKLRVLETVDAQFSVRRTVPYLRQQFGDAQLVFLLGSDVIEHIASWPHIDRLVAEAEFCIGLREGGDARRASHVLTELGVAGRRMHAVQSFAPDVSSTNVRAAIRAKHHIPGVLRSVYKYAQKEWLYL